MCIRDRWCWNRGACPTARPSPPLTCRPSFNPLNSKAMCKPLTEYLGVIRDYTRENVTFGGFVIAVFIYLDFREVVAVYKRQCRYTRESVEQARAFFQTCIKLAQDEHAPLKPSEKACRYCRAQSCLLYTSKTIAYGTA